MCYNRSSEREENGRRQRERETIRASSIDLYKCLSTVEYTETIQASGTLPPNFISTVITALITVMSNLNYAV